MFATRVLALCALAVSAHAITPCGMSCSVDADFLISIVHNKAGDDHAAHRCFANANGCNCYCKIAGENIEVSSTGSLFDATTGAAYTGFSIAAAAEVSGVTIEVANTDAFQTAFISGVSTILSVSTNSIGITGVSATSRRRLLGASAGVSVDYIVYADSAAALTVIADTAVVPAAVVNAIQADYAGPADLTTLACIVPDLSTLGCAVNIPSCPSSESQPTNFIDTAITTAAACTARAQTAMNVCFNGPNGQIATGSATFRPTSAVSTVASGECYIEYTAPCQAGVSLTSGRVLDYNPAANGHSVADWGANRQNHRQCAAQAEIRAKQCYSPSTGTHGTVTTTWVRWGQSSTKTASGYHEVGTYDVDAAAPGCKVSLSVCPSAPATELVHVDLSKDSAESCDAHAQTMADLCYNDAIGGTGTVKTTFLATGAETLADSGECHIGYSAACKPGVVMTSGRTIDFNAVANGFSMGDFSSNRHNHRQCKAAATTLASECYDSANPGTVTTTWSRWSTGTVHPDGQWTASSI